MESASEMQQESLESVRQIGPHTGQQQTPSVPFQAQAPCYFWGVQGRGVEEEKKEKKYHESA
jgi:hypothetical protein